MPQSCSCVVGRTRYQMLVFQGIVAASTSFNHIWLKWLRIQQDVEAFAQDNLVFEEPHKRKRVSR